MWSGSTFLGDGQIDTSVLLRSELHELPMSYKGESEGVVMLKAKVKNMRPVRRAQ
jgi:hypothetical protein